MVPRSSGEIFSARKNYNLIKLEGAPEYVGGYFVANSIEIWNLEGISKTVGEGIEVPWHRDLGILYATELNVRHITLDRAPRIVQKIVNDYIGTGNRGALAMAAELINAH